MSWQIEEIGGRKVLAICPYGHKFTAYGINCRTCPTCNARGFYALLREALERITSSQWIIERSGRFTKGAYNMSTGCLVGAWYPSIGRHFRASIYVITKYPSAPAFEAFLERELIEKLTKWLSAQDSPAAKELLTAVELYQPLESPELAEVDEARAAAASYLAAKDIDPTQLRPYNLWQSINEI